MPVHTAPATGTVAKVITETIREESDSKPPNRPGGHGGGGGGDGGNPGDPSDPGRACQPVRDENKKPNPRKPGGPNDPNPLDDPWDAYSAAPESLRAMIGSTKNSKEAEKITLPALPKAHMFRYWKLTVRKAILSASIDPGATWLWLLEIEKESTTFDTLYSPGDYFRTLDTKLCVAVDHRVKDNDSLKNDIMIATETLAKEGERIAGRQVLLMVYASYKTCVENGTVFDVMDVSQSNYMATTWSTSSTGGIRLF